MKLELINAKTLDQNVISEMAEEKGVWYAIRGFGTIEPLRVAIPKNSITEETEISSMMEVKRVALGEREYDYFLQIKERTVLFNTEWLVLHDGAYVFAYNVRTGERSRPSMVPFGVIAKTIRIKEFVLEEIGTWVSWADFK